MEAANPAKDGGDATTRRQGSMVQCNVPLSKSRTPRSSCAWTAGGSAGRCRRRLVVSSHAAGEITCMAGREASGAELRRRIRRPSLLRHDDGWVVGEMRCSSSPSCATSSPRICILIMTTGDADAPPRSMTLYNQSNYARDDKKRESEFPYSLTNVA